MLKAARKILPYFVVVAALGACVVPGGPPATGGGVQPAATTSTTAPRPVWTPAVDATGATDVSTGMAQFLASVPNGSTIDLQPGGTYRMEKGFRIAGRKNLTIRGNGATFVATTRRATRCGSACASRTAAASRSSTCRWSGPIRWPGPRTGSSVPSAGPARLRHQPLNQRVAQRCQRERHLRRLRVHGSLGRRARSRTECSSRAAPSLAAVGRASP